MSGEEAYVLRFEDPALAARVRAVLAGGDDANPADAALELDFDGEGWEREKRSVCVCVYVRVF